MVTHNIAPPAADWHVTNWSTTVREALGRLALLKYRCAFAIVLAPSVILAGFSLWSRRPVLLVWPLLALWGFGTASTRPTGIGAFASMIIAIAGGVAAVINRDWLFLASGALPGATWIAACVVLGVTATYLLEALEASPELVTDLTNRGILRPVTSGRDGRPIDSPCQAE